MEDCYYFLYSKCMKENCIFRHCEESKENPVTCSVWKATKNCTLDCSFRHSLYHLQKNRSNEMCYWEEKGACTKLFCEYKHKDQRRNEKQQNEGRNNDFNIIENDKTNTKPYSSFELENRTVGSLQNPFFNSNRSEWQGNKEDHFFNEKFNTNMPCIPNIKPISPKFEGNNQSYGHVGFKRNEPEFDNANADHHTLLASSNKPINIIPKRKFVENDIPNTFSAQNNIRSAKKPNFVKTQEYPNETYIKQRKYAESNNKEVIIPKIEKQNHIKEVKPIYNDKIYRKNESTHFSQLNYHRNDSSKNGFDYMDVRSELIPYKSTSVRYNALVSNKKAGYNDGHDSICDGREEEPYKNMCSTDSSEKSNIEEGFDDEYDSIRDEREEEPHNSNWSTDSSANTNMEEGFNGKYDSKSSKNQVEPYKNICSKNNALKFDHKRTFHDNYYEIGGGNEIISDKTTNKRQHTSGFSNNNNHQGIQDQITSIKVIKKLSDEVKIGNIKSKDTKEFLQVKKNTLQVDDIKNSDCKVNGNMPQQNNIYGFKDSQTVFKDNVVLDVESEQDFDVFDKNNNNSIFHHNKDHTENAKQKKISLSNNDKNEHKTNQNDDYKDLETVKVPEKNFYMHENDETETNKFDSHRDVDITHDTNDRDINKQYSNHQTNISENQVPHNTNHLISGDDIDGKINKCFTEKTFGSNLNTVDSNTIINKKLTKETKTKFIKEKRGINKSHKTDTKMSKKAKHVKKKNRLSKNIFKFTDFSLEVSMSKKPNKEKLKQGPVVSILIKTYDMDNVSNYFIKNLQYYNKIYTIEEKCDIIERLFKNTLRPPLFYISKETFEKQMENDLCKT